MSGPYALAAAARYPDRIAAAASFYGTLLVSEAEESPHLSLGKVKGELYIACAEHDKLAPLPMVEELRTWRGRVRLPRCRHHPGLRELHGAHPDRRQRRSDGRHPSRRSAPASFPTRPMVLSSRSQSAPGRCRAPARRSATGRSPAPGRATGSRSRQATDRRPAAVHPSADAPPWRSRRP